MPLKSIPILPFVEFLTLTSIYFQFRPRLDYVILEQESIAKYSLIFFKNLTCR